MFQTAFGGLEHQKGEFTSEKHCFSDAPSMDVPSMLFRLSPPAIQSQRICEKIARCLQSGKI
jgi:hypothetical protein